jgi:hypothetical protein
MFQKQILSLAIILAVSIAAFGQEPQKAMKGYELYSWKADGKWYYSLVTGTNRIKTYEEITSNENVRVGDSALKEELKKLAPGDQVFWMSDAPDGARKAVSSPGMKLPSRQRIKDIMAYCDKLGIRLELR